MSDDERGKKRKVPPSPRYVVRSTPSPAQRLHAAARQRAESRRQALLALGVSDTEGVEDVFVWPLDAGFEERRKRAAARVRLSVGGGRGRVRRERRSRRREAVKRAGWFYEGSFEFECECMSASDALRARKAAVARLLKRVSLLAPPLARAPTPAPSPSLSPSAPAPPEAPPEAAAEAANGQRKKGKKKKKKKSALANEGNPHHIDKYRPSRLPNYAWHSSVLFPPSLAFLAARNRYPVGENEYVCVQCQVALYYSTEDRRRQALAARFRRLARYDPKLRRRRRKGPCTVRRDHDGCDDEEYDDEEYDEEGEDCEDDGYDGDEGMGLRGGGGGSKCTCCREPP